jgi:hypothetical protein
VLSANIVSLLIFISFLTPLTTAITELLKKTLPIKTNYQTLLSIVVSIVIAYFAWIFTDLTTAYRLWAGLFAGLSAAKLYDVTKSLANTFKK